MADKDDLDLQEQVARIRKLNSEQIKAMTEEYKLFNEARKLKAEADKFTWDKVLAPLALIVAGAIGGLVQYLLHH